MFQMSWELYEREIQQLLNELQMIIEQRRFNMITEEEFVARKMSIKIILNSYY